VWAEAWQDLQPRVDDLLAAESVASTMAGTMWIAANSGPDKVTITSLSSGATRSAKSKGSQSDDAADRLAKEV
jgi:hypothetical protein